MTDEQKRHRFRQADFVLIAVVVAIAAVLCAVLYGIPDRAARVVVTVDGNPVADLPLSEDATVTVTGADGGENVVSIENGRVRVTHADCPDKLCAHHAAISRTGQSILCLPHKVAVTITGATTQVDGETG